MLLERMTRKHRLAIIAFAAFITSFTLSSCTSTKNTAYLQNIPDSSDASDIAIVLSQYADPKIQVGDLLLISIQTLDPSSSHMTGTSNNAMFSGPSNQNSSNIPGYLVDKNGNIELPLVGKIKLSNLSTTEAQDAIRQKASIYYKDPVVNVRFANFNITVLGEVRNPAQYTVPTQRVTLLDAIGLAGDLTIYGERENILLIREENGTKKFVRFDLTNSEFMRSPYFYLKQNDVIYVEPNKAKVASTNAVKDRNVGYAISIISSLISIGIILATR